MNFLSYFAVKYVEQLEDMSKSLKYCLGYILKGQKVLNERMKRENNGDSILKIQHSGGTGTTSCVVHKMMNYQIDKKQKQTKKPAYQLPTTVLFLLQSLLLVKFSFFVLSVFFWAEG